MREGWEDLKSEVFTGYFHRVLLLDIRKTPTGFHSVVDNSEHISITAEDLEQAMVMAERNAVKYWKDNKRRAEHKVKWIGKLLDKYAALERKMK